MTDIHAPKGTARFWKTVLFFAIANVVIWIGYHQHLAAHRQLLRVEEFTPGSQVCVGEKSIFTWRFNVDVVAKPGPVPPGAPPMTVTPATAGSFVWSDARTLNFTPAANLERATAYIFELNPRALVSRDGFTLAAPWSESVFTAPLSVLNVHQSESDAECRFTLEIAFNDKVLPGEAFSHLRIEEQGGRAIKLDLLGDKQASSAVRVRTEPLSEYDKSDGMNLLLVLSSGLAGQSGPLGLPVAYSATVALDRRLLLEEITAHAPARGQPTISVRFNQQIDKELLNDLIAIDPPVAFQVTSGYQVLELQGDFQCGSRYAVKLSAPPPGTKLPARLRPETRGIFIPDRQAAAWFEHEEGYLGTQGNRTVLAHAVNISKIDVSIRRVYENTLCAWNTTSSRRRAPDFSGPAVHKQIELPVDKNKVQDIRLVLPDLLPLVDSRDGTYHIQLSPVGASVSAFGEPLNNDDEYESSVPASALVTLSDIGLSAKLCRNSLQVWATSLKSAQPLPSIRVRAFSNKSQPLGEAVTGADGLATIAPLNPAEGETCAVVLAERIGDDKGGKTSSGITWLDLGKGSTARAANDTTGKPYLREGYDAFIFTDRGVYRPGDRLYLNAIVRGAEGNSPAPFPVRWRLCRPDRQDWLTQNAILEADGSTRWSVALPDNLPTGNWTAHLSLPHEKAEKEFGNVSFQIEEFMPDRIKVDVQLSESQSGDTESRLKVSDKPVTAHITGNYLFGQPAAKCQATLHARFDPIAFAPTGWTDWTFGDSANVLETLSGKKLRGDQAAPVSKKTRHPVEEHGPSLSSDPGPMTLNENGSAEWEIPSPLSDDAAEKDDTYRGPWRMTVCGSVCEAGGRAVSSTRQVHIDALPYYIDARTRQIGKIEIGAANEFDIALMTPDGTVPAIDTALEARIYVETFNSSFTYRDGSYKYQCTRLLEPLPGEHKEIKVEVKAGRGTCRIAIPANGAYVLQLRDAQTRALTSLAWHVSSGEWWNESISLENPERIDLALLSSSDTESASAKQGGSREFKLGESVNVVVRSPFAGELLLAVETDTLVWHRVLTMEKPCTTIPILVTSAMSPNAYVSATVIRGIDPNAQWRTHRAIGVIPLTVAKASRNLTTEIVCAPDIRPNSSLDVTATLRDASGAPQANATVTLIAVDEGILSLTHFETPDPLSAFMAKRALGVFSSDIYSQLMPEAVQPGAASTVGGDGSGDRDESNSRYRTPVSARRVVPVALVSPPLHTDEQGRVSTKFAVPYFSGQLRIMSVSHAGNKFGSASANVRVGAPLLVQSSWPRFAAPNDKFSATVTIFNNTGRNGDAKIALELPESPDLTVMNALQLPGGSQNRMEFPPVNIGDGGQATIQLPVAARFCAGVGHARIVARLNGEECVETIELPVRPASPQVTQGGCIAASLEKSARFEAPAAMLPGSSNLEVRVTPWPELELPRGLDYLNTYPHGCAEQTVSTCFPLVYLSEIGEKIAPGYWDKAGLEEKVQVGIDRLLSMRTHEGGVAMWPGNHDTWPWASIYAAHFLLEAKAAGHKVPEGFTEQLLGYARHALNKTAIDAETFETQAYACFVLALAGKPDRSAMDRLSEVSRDPRRAAGLETRELSPSFHTLVAAAWLRAGRADLALERLPGNIPLERNTRQLSGNVGSAARDRALLLMTLQSTQPENPQLPILAQQLADDGREGRWQSTQDTAFSVMALGRYLKQLEKAPQFENAEIWSGGKPLARSEHGQPLVWKAAGPEFDARQRELEVRIGGPAGAKGFASWKQSGIPLKPLAASDRGLKVRRQYFDKNGEPLALNTIYSGMLVRAELTLWAPETLANVVLEDLLPAGLEIENPRLESAATDLKKPSKEETPADSFEIQHMDVRDDRLVLVGAVQASKNNKYVYLARAVTPGVYAMPQVRAECMYARSVSSLSGENDLFTVLPPETPRNTKGAMLEKTASK